MSIAYISKPDRGGIERCERIFGFESLNEKGLTPMPFRTWKVFESPKFRMKIDEGKIDEFKNYVSAFGYNDWIKGGVQFGSVNLGWGVNEMVYVSKIRVGKGFQFIVHDVSGNMVYMIDFQN